MKRGRDEDEDEVIDNYHCKRHEWLCSSVSGSGGLRSGQQTRMSGQEKGRGAARGDARGATRGTSMGNPWLDMGPRGGKKEHYRIIE